MLKDEFPRLLALYAAIYPPLISIADAVEIARHETPGTIYDWSSRKLLDPIKVKRGKYVYFELAGFVHYILTGNCHVPEKDSTDLVASLPT